MFLRYEHMFPKGTAERCKEDSQGLNEQRERYPWTTITVLPGTPAGVPGLLNRGPGVSRLALHTWLLFLHRSAVLNANPSFLRSLLPKRVAIDAVSYTH